MATIVGGMCSRLGVQLLPGSDGAPHYAFGGGHKDQDHPPPWSFQQEAGGFGACKPGLFGGSRQGQLPAQRESGLGNFRQWVGRPGFPSSAHPDHRPLHPLSVLAQDQEGASLCAGTAGQKTSGGALEWGVHCMTVLSASRVGHQPWQAARSWAGMELGVVVPEGAPLAAPAPESLPAASRLQSHLRWLFNSST